MKLSAQFDTDEIFCGLSGNSRGGEDGGAPFVSRDERFGLCFISFLPRQPPSFTSPLVLVMYLSPSLL